jgi:hypothetical protein
MKSLPAVIIALVVVAAAGCAGGGGSATVAPTVDVTGKWAGTFVSFVGGSTIGLGGGTIELTLKQTGSQVIGNLVVRGAVSDPSGPFEGTVSGNELRIIQPSKLNGIFTVRGDSMSGDVRGGMSHKIYLQRQK